MDSCPFCADDVRLRGLFSAPLHCHRGKCAGGSRSANPPLYMPAARCQPGGGMRFRFPGEILGHNGHRPGRRPPAGLLSRGMQLHGRATARCARGRRFIRSGEERRSPRCCRPRVSRASQAVLQSPARQFPKVSRSSTAARLHSHEACQGLSSNSRSGVQPIRTESIETDPPSTPSTGNVSFSDAARDPAT